VKNPEINKSITQSPSAARGPEPDPDATGEATPDGVEDDRVQKQQHLPQTGTAHRHQGETFAIGEI